MPTDLFPPSFVAGIRQLRIVSRHRLAGVEQGAHAARRAGTGLDFRDYRPYQPGDDLRRVDWNVYRRSRRLITRVYDEVERLAVHVLLDTSTSMYFENPPRADAARQVAVALAAAGLRQHDRVTVFPFGDGLSAPIRLRSQPGLPALMRELAGLQPAGPMALTRAAAELGRMRLPLGLLVVVSDFFDPAGVEAVAAALGNLRHRLALVQIIRADDGNPRLSGDVRVVDCETGVRREVEIDAAALAAYRSAYDRFHEALAAFAARRQAPLVQIDAGADVLNQLTSLFPGGVLRL